MRRPRIGSHRRGCRILGSHESYLSHGCRKHLPDVLPVGRSGIFRQAQQLVASVCRRAGDVRGHLNERRVTRAAAVSPAAGREETDCTGRDFVSWRTAEGSGTDQSRHLCLHVDRPAGRLARVGRSMTDQSHKSRLLDITYERMYRVRCNCP